jgi:hypothetical protein
MHKDKNTLTYQVALGRGIKVEEEIRLTNIRVQLEWLQRFKEA